MRIALLFAGAFYAACGGSSSSPDGATAPSDAAVVDQGVPAIDSGMTTLDGAASNDLASGDGASKTGGAYCANSTAAICDDFTDAAKTAKQFTTTKDATSSITIGTSNAVTYKSGPTAHVHMGSTAGSYAWLTTRLPTPTVQTLYGRMRLYVAPIGTATGWPNDHTDFFLASDEKGDNLGLDEQYMQVSSISLPEVGGEHYLYPGCTDGASKCSSEPWPSGKWMCLEWEFTNAYIDIYNDNRGGTNLIYWLYDATAKKSDLLTDQYGSETQFPTIGYFTSVQLGGALYGTDTSQGNAFDFYYANFAVGSTRFDDCASDE